MKVKKIKMHFDRKLEQICENCGCTYGSHHAGQSPIPYGYCPGHEGQMDWENNTAESVFKPSGKFKE